MRILFQMASTDDFSDAAKDAYLSDSSLYLGSVKEDAPLGCIFDESAGEAPDMPYLNWAFVCVRDNLKEIDDFIARSSEKWSVGRMSTLDLSILRLAVAEIKYMDDIDASVSVNEAVSMAHKYGSEKSPAFINGVLGAVTRGEDAASGSGADQ